MIANITGPNWQQQPTKRRHLGRLKRREAFSLAAWQNRQDHQVPDPGSILVMVHGRKKAWVESETNGKLPKLWGDWKLEKLKLLGAVTRREELGTNQSQTHHLFTRKNRIIRTELRAYFQTVRRAKFGASSSYCGQPIAPRGRIGGVCLGSDQVMELLGNKSAKNARI